MKYLNHFNKYFIQLKGVKSDVDYAVNCAEKAFKSWSETKPHIRAR